MRKSFLILAGLVFIQQVYSQNIDARIVVDNASTASNTILQFQVKTKAGTQNYVGVNMYFLYQDTKLAPQSTGDNTVVGINDALLTTTYGWGNTLRTTTPFQSFGPATYNGQSYNKRFVYINADETGGTNMQTLTTTWVTIFTVTFNNLQATYPQGGYGYLQETAEFINGSLVNEFGANVPIDVISGSTPLGVNAPGAPDLTSSQFFSTTQLAPGAFLEEVISLRNVGSGSTTGPITFNITNYSALTGLTISVIPAGTNVTIGIDNFTMSSGWTYNAGTFTSSNVLGPGSANYIGIRITRGTGPSAGANGSVTQTTTVSAGTGGGETPLTNNSISNLILKF